MQGRVKFYKADEGCGVIVGKDDKNYRFSMLDIAFGEMPQYGSFVNFEPKETKGESIATKVRVVSEKNNYLLESSDPMSSFIWLYDHSDVYAENEILIVDDHSIEKECIVRQ